MNLFQFVRAWCAAHRNRAASLAVGAIWFALLFADRLVWRESVSIINRNGWIWLVATTVPWALLALVPLWLLGRRSRFVYVPLVLAMVFFLSVEWFVRLNFGMLLDGDIVGIVLGSSPDELSWFVRHSLTLGFGAYLLCCVAVVALCLRGISSARRFTVTRGSAVLSVLALALFVFAEKVPSKGLRVLEQLSGVHLVVDSVRSYRTYDALVRMQAHPQVPAGLSADNAAGTVTGVIVLGESATRTHWGLYGYARDTTPCLAACRTSCVRFSDLTTPVSSTAQALRMIFTTATVERKSDFRYTMAQALRQAGFATALYSNQARWGEWEEDESFVFSGCEPMCFMCETDETNRYDEVLLPYLEKSLASTEGNRVIFLHLAGSHIPCEERYPHDGAPFEPEVFRHSYDRDNPPLARNHYDNSIWYTDKVLGGIIDRLKGLKRPAWMVYLSDHGETPSSPGWRTATDLDLWAVPFVVWLSDEFRAAYPTRVAALEEAKDRALRSDQLFGGLLTLAGVTGLASTPEGNLFDPAFPLPLLPDF